MELSALAPAGPTVSPDETLDFDRVYDEHVDFVWRSARRLGIHEESADDVVQKVFLVVYRRLAEFGHRSTLKTWIWSILLRVVQEHRRTLRRKSPHWLQSEHAEPELLPDTEGDPFEQLSRADALQVIDLLLDSLEGDKRVVFILAELEEMTAPEIAKATGLDTKAVYSRLRAARTDFERAAARLRRDALGRKP